MFVDTSTNRSREERSTRSASSPGDLAAKSTMVLQIAAPKDSSSRKGENISAKELADLFSTSAVGGGVVGRACAVSANGCCAVASRPIVRRCQWTRCAITP